MYKPLKFCGKCNQTNKHPKTRMKPSDTATNQCLKVTHLPNVKSRNEMLSCMSLKPACVVVIIHLALQDTLLRRPTLTTHKA